MLTFPTAAEAASRRVESTVAPDVYSWRYHVVARNVAGSGTTYAASVSAAFDRTLIQQNAGDLDDSGTNSVLVSM